MQVSVATDISQVARRGNSLYARLNVLGRSAADIRATALN
jgi:hypothetical protein